MKRWILFPMVFAVLLTAPAQAQQDVAAARAARDEMLDRYKEITAKLIDIADTQDLLRKRYDELDRRIAGLVSKIERLEHSQAESGTRTVTHSQLKELADKVREIDEKRGADKKLILDTIAGLQKLPVATPPATVENKHAPVALEAAADGWTYVVQKGDSLGEIVAAYNRELRSQGKKGTITQSQVIAANPGLRANNIYVGRKILIPKPSSKD